VGHHGQGVEGDTAVVGGVGVRVGTTEALRWLKTLRVSVPSVLSAGQWFRGGGVVGHHGQGVAGDTSVAGGVGIVR
jgi:hypothetical protein